MRSLSLLLTLSALASAQTFTTCKEWPTVCQNAIIPNTCVGLTPMCFSPSASQVCAGCMCKGGPLAGTTQGGTVEIGIDAETCNQFFATNSTPTSINGAPVLGGSPSTTSVKSSAAATSANTVAPSASAGAANANSNSGASAVSKTAYALILVAALLL
ncbi:hypothetical protein BC830DRAFT_1132226 [Chytriomyces sp. MP71]|nr:hypothetical protein BC830DRAFT_1132226 [Chytriomyces sp. MP71]